MAPREAAAGRATRLLRGRGSGRADGGWARSSCYGAPVYVRKEIVHNKHVVEQLAAREGPSFVESETDVPEGATVVFSAHGVAPSVHANARRRALRTIDATCPLVTKVHVEARKFAADGYTIVLVGHAGHEEVEGTMGEAPDHIILIESAQDVDRLEVRDPSKVAYISQTTLSVDETRAIISRLRERFPAIIGPRTDDICYATTNRQAAVKQLARECELVLVVGSRNSSNSNRLVEVAREHGADSHLIDNEGQVRDEWLDGQAGGRHHLRRQRSRAARPALGRLLPSAGHQRRAAARGRAGGRTLHAPQADPPGGSGRPRIGLRDDEGQSRSDAGLLRPCAVGFATGVPRGKRARFCTPSRRPCIRR